MQYALISSCKISRFFPIIVLPTADVDLVVHAAGPFQQREKCNVLEAAISTKVGEFKQPCSLTLC